MGGIFVFCSVIGMLILLSNIYLLFSVGFALHVGLYNIHKSLHHYAGYVGFLCRLH
jgi:hypothetical protein